MTKKTMSSVIKDLKKAFAGCDRPPNDRLISVGGVDLIDAEKALRSISPSDIDAMPAMDEELAGHLSNLSSDGRRYFLPSVAGKILESAQESSPWAIWLVLTWIRRSTRPRKGPHSNYFGICLNSDQVAALADYVDIIPNVLTSSPEFKDDFRELEQWRDEVRSYLDTEHPIEDFDKL